MPKTSLLCACTLIACSWMFAPALAQPGEPAEPAVPVLPPIQKGFPVPPPPEPEPEPEPVQANGPEPVPEPEPEPAPVPVPDAPPSPVPPIEPQVQSPADPYATREVLRTRYVPGRGFQLRTADDDFELAVGLWAQLRYRYRHLVGPDRQLLTVDKARLTLSGHLFGEHQRFFVMLGFSPDDTALGPAPVVGLPDPAASTRGGDAELATGTDVVRQSPLLDLYFDFDQARDLSLRVGQFRLPFSRQRMIPERGRQLTGRAVADQEFQLDRDVGLLLYSDDLGGLDLLRYAAGVFIGEGRNAGSQSIGAGDRGLLYLARMELLPAGRFDVTTEADFARAPAPRVALGLAYALLQADATSPHGERLLSRVLGGAEQDAIVDFNAHGLTSDVLLKVSGLSVQGAIHFRTFDGARGARRGMGYMLQAGYLVNRPALEPVVRYSLVRGSGLSSLPDVDALDFALNYYMARNQLKLTMQLGHIWSDRGFAKGEDRAELLLQVGL